MLNSDSLCDIPNKDKNDQLSKQVVEVGFLHHHCEWFICLSVLSEGGPCYVAASIFPWAQSQLFTASINDHNSTIRETLTLTPAAVVCCEEGF